MSIGFAYFVPPSDRRRKAREKDNVVVRKRIKGYRLRFDGSQPEAETVAVFEATYFQGPTNGQVQRNYFFGGLVKGCSFKVTVLRRSHLPPVLTQTSI